MKTTLVYICILIILLGCTNSKKIKIGFCADNFIHERWNKDRDLFIEKVNEYGGEVLVTVSKGDPKKQVQQAQDLINQGVQVLVVVPSGQKAVSDIIDIAHEKGVKVISYDRLMKGCDLDFYISFDHVKVGQLQAEYIIKAKPKGKYMIVGGGITDNNAFMIRAGQKAVLQDEIENGNITIVQDEFSESWMEQEGYNLAMNGLAKSSDSIDAVLAANDALAMGVIRALEEKGLNLRDIPVSGMDADRVACESIKEGKLYMTIYKPIKSIANEAARIAVKYAKGEELDPTMENIVSIHNGLKNVPSILLPSMVLTKENVKLIYPD